MSVILDLTPPLIAYIAASLHSHLDNSKITNELLSQNKHGFLKLIEISH